MQKKPILVLFLALLLTIGIGQAQDDAQPVFRIGVLDSERGPITQGARLAVQELNAAGGVEGAEGTRFRLELIIEETRPGDDLEAAIEDIEQARVIAVLGPETTEDVLINLPLLQSLNVPILTPAIGDTVIASDTTNVLFRTRAPERLQGSALAAYLMEDLGAENITIIQLDRNSTAGRVGFEVAVSQLEDPPALNTLLLEEPEDIDDLVDDIIELNPPYAVVYGAPTLASVFYDRLREGGWFGTFAYSDAADPLFSESAPTEELTGVISTTTWPLAARDVLSNRFLNDYVRTFNDVPGPVAAASYDAIYLLAEAIGEAGDLRTNLEEVRDLEGVQGTLNPVGLTPGETSDSVAVTELNALGGFDVVARYEATDRIPIVADPQVVAEGDPDTSDEPTPTLTVTPEGTFITIRSSVQNVRTGPGLDYTILGQLRQGEQERVIGATADFSWVVVEFRGQNGWLATYLLDVMGERSDVPVLTPPPTPTPPPATATPTRPPLPDIVITSVSPSNLTLGVLTNVNVTVRNAGVTDAGQFAIAATFPPDSYYSAANINGLVAGSEIVVTLPVQLSSSTGSYQTAIIADLNNQINEGEVGEANNDDFIFTYRLDRQLILINNTTLNAGASIDLEGNVTPIADIQYTGTGINTSGNCTGTNYCIGLLSPEITWDTATYDSVTGNNGINGTFVPNSSLTVGTTLGVLTGEGRRAVIRVDAINPGVSITLTYRVYQQPQ